MYMTYFEYYNSEISMAGLTTTIYRRSPLEMNQKTQ